MLAVRVIDVLPSVTVKLLKATLPELPFYDFEDFERLVKGATKVGPEAVATVLLGGHAGLRRGQMVASEWSDIDLKRAFLTVRRRRVGSGPVSYDREPSGGPCLFPVAAASSRVRSTYRSRPARSRMPASAQNEAATPSRLSSCGPNTLANTSGSSRRTSSCLP
jgi:integrase